VTTQPDLCGPVKPSIMYGDLDILQPPFTWEAGGKFGSPELVKQILQQQLQDGEIVTSVRASNRELELTFMIRSSDLGACALAEADLIREATKAQNTIIFDPGDGKAPPTVFDTFPADVVHDREDVKDTLGIRDFVLTIPALPYARSKTLVTTSVPAPPPSIITTEIDDCTSTTGWAVTGSVISPTVSTSSGAVIASSPGSNPTPWWVMLTRSGLSVDISALPYLKVEVFAKNLNGTYEFFINGSSTPATVIAVDGQTYTLDADAITTLTDVAVKISYGIPNTSAFGELLRVLDISATNATTGGTTGRENARQIPVAGSARTQASLHLVDPDDALGSVLVYTTTDLTANNPPLRQWQTVGPSPVSDPSTVSGSTSDLATAHKFDLPAAGVTPGGYLLLARVKATATGDKTISWVARSRMGTTDISEAQAGSRLVALTADTWTIVTVGLMNLPPTQVGPDGKIRIELTTDPVSLTLDEAWLFNLDTGRLSWVECGDGTPATGGPSNRLWLDTASAPDPKPSIWRGTEENRSDSIHAGPDTESWGAHEFVPSAISVFTVTTFSTAAELLLEYFPRWHSHAAL
jgi:hypothetical protein